MSRTTHLIVISGLLALASPPAGSVEGHILIAAPTTISAPGSYVVTQNLSVAGTALAITADDVHLDLNGFRVRSTSTTVPAIDISSNNVTVRNGSVSGGSNAILVNAARNFVLEDVNTGNADAEGLKLVEIEGFAVRRSSFTSHGDQGIWASGSFTLTHAGGAIEDNQVTFCGGGIFIQDSKNALLTGNRISVVFGWGIELVDVLSGVLRGNSLEGNIKGAYLRGTTRGVVVVENVLSDTDDQGVQVAADDNLLLNNTIDGGREDGLIVEGSRNLIVGNLLTNHWEYGLLLGATSADNVYRRNTARGNQLVATPCSGTSTVDLCDEGSGNTSSGDNFLPGLQ